MRSLRPQRSWRFVTLLTLGAALMSLFVAPAVILLPQALRDPFADHGTMQIVFVNEGTAEVRLVSLTFAGRTIVQPGLLDQPQMSVPAPAERNLFSLGPRAKAGRQDVELVYRFAGSESAGWHFQVDVVAQHACTVLVTFTASGPRATPCGNLQRES
jgi:hypothetical protein